VTRAFAAVCLAYLVAGAAALAAGAATPSESPLVVAAVADVVATVAVFAFSVAFRNSSFYDPYWSVAPIAIALYFAARADPGTSAGRQLLVIALVAAWGVRLTWNWARGWTGLAHEDWRYRDIQQATGAFYWPASFLGIHLMPTLLVLLGCLPLYLALATGTRPLGPLDGLAALVTGGALALEAVSDQQLRRFVAARRDASELLTTGLWAASRHPNYCGEMLFWWGLFLFGLAADPGGAWTAIGAASISALFFGVSLPMIERRHRARKPAWAGYAARTPLLVPWPRRRSGTPRGGV
jgi:steroid 5-alpha reductase family enzyme